MARGGPAMSHSRRRRCRRSGADIALGPRQIRADGALRIRHQLVGGDLAIEIRVDRDLGRLTQDCQCRLGDGLCDKDFPDYA